MKSQVRCDQRGRSPVLTGTNHKRDPSSYSRLVRMERRYRATSPGEWGQPGDQEEEIRLLIRGGVHSQLSRTDAAEWNFSVSAFACVEHQPLPVTDRRDRLGTSLAATSHTAGPQQCSSAPQCVELALCLGDGEARVPHQEEHTLPDPLVPFGSIRVPPLSYLYREK
ncbi:hypothetical protein H920_18173 [Fukomys damarensis]|uniref:Uncharacterized protein n=1 Tax=Fukomys damarensis TaxID=885580 RepID=A0A091CQM0_FUKDA|nr:hypothetical protein H920_18173 [Fukomys damarensis]